jgi:SAM-dependent methyltransferase
MLEAPARPCRFCAAPLRQTVVDLGMSPLCERFLTPAEADAMEPFYPLTVAVCEQCWLVQLPQYVGPETIFTEYAYFSSYSASWLDHARAYVDAIVERLELSPRHSVVELGSNDGYLLRNFVQRGIAALGVEPARNVAKAANAAGVETLAVFFGRQTAETIVAERGPADLVIGNNVLAQVPDLNDFVAGIATLLAPDGVVTLEFPHLLRLVEETQYDTIYHEHFSYFSLLAVRALLDHHGLRVFDVEELRSHGGSLRTFACHVGSERFAVLSAVERLVERELAEGYATVAPYAAFRERVEESRWGLLELLLAARRSGKRVAGYGAPGKGNTLLNYCGIRSDLLEFTVDRNPYKHGRLLPGTHIPVFPPERIAETKPDVILILPWNLREEIARQLEYTREWGAELVVPIPRATVVARDGFPATRG